MPAQFLVWYPITLAEALRRRVGRSCLSPEATAYSCSREMVLEHWEWGETLSGFPSCAFISIPLVGLVGPLQVVTYVELGVHIWLTTV